MENSNVDPEDEYNHLSWQKSHRRGKIMGGLVVVTLGVLFLLREANVPIAGWILSWQMVLIAIGSIMLVKDKFKRLPGYVLILLGSLFLLRSWYPHLINFQFIWPVAIILVGLMIIFKPHKPKMRRKHWGKWNKHRQRFMDFEHMDETTKAEWKKHRHHFMDFENLEEISKDDYIDSVSFFSGIKKNVVSKQFRGADVVTIFGGSEINLLQSDFEKKAIVDITCLFGGMTLIVPSNWQVKSELTAVFGGIEDKTKKNPNIDEVSDKVLILRGTCLFGGIEINNLA